MSLSLPIKLVAITCKGHPLRTYGGNTKGSREPHNNSNERGWGQLGGHLIGQTEKWVQRSHLEWVRPEGGKQKTASYGDQEEMWPEPKLPVKEEAGFLGWRHRWRLLIQADALMIQRAESASFEPQKADEQEGSCVLCSPIDTHWAHFSCPRGSCLLAMWFCSLQVFLPRLGMGKDLPGKAAIW